MHFSPSSAFSFTSGDLGIEIVRNFGLAPSFPKLQLRFLLLNLYLFPLFISCPPSSIQSTPCSAGTAGTVPSVLLIS